MQDQRGITLIEVLIYIVFVSIISFTFVNFALDVVTTAQKSRVRQEVQQNVRFALQRIAQEIRASNGLNVGSSTFDTHPGVLSLATDDAGTDPTVFDVSSGVLRITEGVGAAEPLTLDTLDVTNLVFKNFSVTNRTTNIKATLTIAHPNPEGIELYDVSVTMQVAAVIREVED